MRAHNKITLNSRRKIAFDCFCYLLLLLSAGALAWILVSTSSKVNNAYYERWPLVGDTASYWVRDLRIVEKAEVIGFRAAVLQETLNNPRDPLRIIAYAFTGPEGVTSRNGHLYFSAFAALMFFWMLGLCLFERSKSLLYALAVPVSSLLALGILHPMYGAPSRLPDLPAAMLLGAALFALILSRNGSWRWTFGAGALAGLAALTRYHAVVYGVFMLGPLVSLYAFGKHVQAGRRPAEIFRRAHLAEFARQHLPFFAGLGLTAGFYVFWWARDVFSFYAIAGYGLNHTVEIALRTTGWKLIFQYFGVPALTSMLLVMAGYIAVGRHEADVRRDWIDHLAIAWVATSSALLILGIMRVQDDISQTYYMVPGLLLLTLSPFPLRRPAGDGERNWRLAAAAQARRPLTVFAAIAGVVLYGSVAASNYVYLKSEQFLYPREREQHIRRFNSELAEVMGRAAVNSGRLRQGLPAVDSNFDYYARYMVPEIFSRTGQLTRFANVFEIRQSQWQLSGTGEELADKAEIMQKLMARVDVFAALDEFSSPNVMDVLKDEYTVRLAEFVASEMKTHPECWMRVGRVASPYGAVVVYENVAKGRNSDCVAPVGQSTAK